MTQPDPATPSRNPEGENTPRPWPELVEQIADYLARGAKPEPCWHVPDWFVLRRRDGREVHVRGRIMRAAQALHASRSG